MHMSVYCTPCRKKTGKLAMISVDNSVKSSAIWVFPPLKKTEKS